MNDMNFENYQKRMLNAVQNPNKQSNDPFTKLSNILENLNRLWITVHSLRLDSSTKSKNSLNLLILLAETARHFKKTLEDFCSTKNEALKTISELHSMVKPISTQVGSWSAVASIANEYMAENWKSIFHSK